MSLNSTNHSSIKVSVLVAAWNEAPRIADFIRAFQSLRYPSTELILCAGGHDNTFNIAKQFESDRVVILQQQSGEGKQKALQRSLARSTGEIIFLTDADCLLDDHVFEHTLEPLLEGHELVTSGTFRPLTQQLGNPWVLYQWSIELFVAKQTPAYVQGLQGRNCAIARDVLEAVGEFKEKVPVGTDFFLAKKLGAAQYPIRHVPDSAIETWFPETFSTYIRKQSRWIRNLLIHGPRFRSWWDVRASLRTMLMGAGMLLWPLTFFRTRLWGIFVWLAAIGYGIAARTRYLQFSRQYIDRDLSLVFPRLPMYMWVDFIAWTLALLDYLRPDKREQW